MDAARAQLTELIEKADIKDSRKPLNLAKGIAEACLKYAEARIIIDDPFPGGEITEVRTDANCKRALVMGSEATVADNVDADSIADVIMEFTDELLDQPGYYADVEGISTSAFPLPTAWEMAADLLEKEEEGDESAVDIRLSFADDVNYLEWSAGIIEKAIQEYIDARVQTGSWHDVWMDSNGTIPLRKVAESAAKRILEGPIDET